MGIDLDIKINVTEIVGIIGTTIGVVVLLVILYRCTVEQPGTFGVTNALDECMNECQDMFTYNEQRIGCTDKCFDFFDKHPDLINREIFEKEMNITVLDWLLEGQI